MPVDRDRLRKDKQRKKGGEFFKFDPGDTCIYVCDECVEGDGINYVETCVHYGVGPDDKMVICLDPSNNQALEHPLVKRYLEDRGIDIAGGCPVCDALPGRKAEARKRQRAQDRFMFQIVPWKFRAKKSIPFADLGANMVQPAFVGFGIWDGITDAMEEEGDIYDLDKAILVKVNRTGTGPTDTRYKVTVDSTSLKNPIRIGKGLRRVLRDALREGGSADSYKTIAEMIRSTKQVEELMTGVATTSDEDDGDDEASGRPECFGLDYCDDDECAECEHRFECAPKCNMELYPHHGGDDEAGDDDSADPEAEDADELERELGGRPKRKAPARAKAGKGKAGKGKAGKAKGRPARRKG